jgi:formylglycine-generating enzyme
MNVTAPKVVIKLADVGTRREAVLTVLSKIQGLSASPEELVANAPCYISGKVARPLAEKVQSYLERAGAVVELEPQEMPSAEEPLEETYTADYTPEQPPEASEEYHLAPLEEHHAGVVYEVTEDQTPAETDSSYFSADSLPHTPTSVTAEPDEQPPSSYPDPSSVTEALYEEAPHPEPRPRKRRRRPKPRRPFPVGLLVAGLAAVLLIGLFALYATGTFSRVTQRYANSTGGSQVGTLTIDNPAGAAITLHRVLGTRVVEPVPLSGDTIRLPRGDYYVEARKDNEVLRYPAYIAGRGHQLRVTVSFPEQQAFPPNMAYIPAGWFRMGNKETDVAHFGFPDEEPDIDVYVSAFLINKHEVTNEEYAEFVEAGGYENQLYWEELIKDWEALTQRVPSYADVYGDDGWKSVRLYLYTRFINTDDMPGPRLWEEDAPPYDYNREEYPVFGITLYEAAAYCRWLTQQTGKLHRLPTEAEWEKAARGYEGYFFAYGNEYDASRANTESSGTKQVGSYPPNGYGVYDLTGNVWEWVADHYQPDTYQWFLEHYQSEIRNPMRFDEQQRYERRIVRGGSFRSVNQINAKTTIRYPMFPNDWHTNIGFRYVSAP